jgi:hypothetical protein
MLEASRRRSIAVPIDDPSLSLGSVAIYRHWLEELSRTIVRHGQYLERFTDIGICHLRSGTGQRIRVIQIVGDSGSGKSTLKKDYAARFPPYRSAEGQKIVPVLSIDIPSKPTPRKILQRILKGLGDPAYKRRRGDLVDDVDESIIACKVTLILIDEWNHLIDRANRNVPGEVAEFLKEFLDRHDVSVVLFGLKRCTSICERHDQLRERVAPTAKPLDPLVGYVEYEDGVRIPEFQKLLAELDDAQPFPNFGLEEGAIASKMLAATGAYPGRTVGVLAGAIESAVLRRKSKLTEGDFHNGFEYWVQRSQLDPDDPDAPVENPFIRDAADGPVIIPPTELVEMIKKTLGIEQLCMPRNIGSSDEDPLIIH